MPKVLPADLPPLEDRLSFSFHQITAQMARICNPLFRSYGIDVISARILVLTLEADVLEVSRVRKLMHLPHSTLAHQIQRIENHGYVMRARSKVDGRAITLTLTSKGNEVAQACERLSIAVHQAVHASLTAMEIAAMQSGTAKILSALSQLGENDGADSA
ncbi:MarR family winged helix-turn-helix transcriptional regulator [Sphingosinicella microcystinivorans]|uniref:MarR family transcriptional regulator n=1 Tax=Sphingosinicella microcystinivorans TaxID=335406 RepID=A0AAD1D815_SPHMI|nr:MarR family winged helix-turn-helix transcriptional regulator [Sphingosinicella microcystinivorans]RKS86336.1 MarR family transcriptional regulator [Sphingosinicella microcystinivorans]BBE35618.1 hypothetical protein SmB9_32760 [Sphingosinicella microcystinivorans]